MPRKPPLTKLAVTQSNDQTDLHCIAEDVPMDINLNLDNLKASAPKNIIDQLIEKETRQCAQKLKIDVQELQAWVKLYAHVPQRSQLHLLRTANHYGLDPLQEEVLLMQYEQGWQITISVDGWIKIMNRHPHFSGVTFLESNETDQGLPIWMECTISRTDRAMPITVREYLSEVRQEGELWHKMPRRMLRHRTLQQCARIAMAISTGESKEPSSNPSITTVLNSQAPKISNWVCQNGKNETQTGKLKAVLQNK